MQEPDAKYKNAPEMSQTNWACSNSLGEWVASMAKSWNQKQEVC